VDIPIIASVNCTSGRWWVPYAKNIEAAGADGLELNISHFPQGGDRDIRDIERRYARTVEEVCSQVKIPVAVKIGPYFTSITEVVHDLAAAGASAVVLFNRFYMVDIDIERKQFTPATALSNLEDIYLPLRWLGLLAGNVTCDLAASTGIHDARGVIKALMAGASAAYLCTALYRNGIAFLDKIRRELEEWLDDNEYTSISGIRGAAGCNTGNADILLYRLQYIKALEDTAT